MGFVEVRLSRNLLRMELLIEGAHAVKEQCWNITLMLQAPRAPSSRVATLKLQCGTPLLLFLDALSTNQSLLSSPPSRHLWIPRPKNPRYHHLHNMQYLTVRWTMLITPLLIVPTVPT